MALLSDKVYLGTDLLDLLLQPHRLPGTAVERSLVDQHIVSQEGVVDHFLDSLFPSSEENLKPCSPLWVPSPCDSGISEDAMDSPHPSYPEATHYTKEAAYSPSPVPGSPLFPAMFLPQVVKMEPDFSIDLADWEAGLFSEGLSSSSSATTISPSPIQKSLTVKDLLLSNMAEPSKPSTQQSRQLILNDDEKKLLVKEGVSLPSQLPLNKYEEKILKKIRRKIRNKQSAQESRKKKKEYVDGLEGRMAACSAHNQELQRKVFQLEKSNTSLLEQLRQLQSLLLNGSSKPAQTGTCILVLVLSFSLILIPSLQPVSHRKTSDLGDIGSAKVQSRSLRSVMEVYTVEPGLSVTRDLDVSSNTKHKLDIRPEYADMSPSRQNHSYRENKRHHHGDPITGHATALSLMTRQQIDKE